MELPALYPPLTGGAFTWEPASCGESTIEIRRRRPSNSPTPAATTSTKTTARTIQIHVDTRTFSQAPSNSRSTTRRALRAARR